MKWIEWINVQTANLSETTLDYIRGMTTEIVETPGLVSIEVCMHAILSGNIALLLIWESDARQPWGSMAGLQLAGELRKFGLVAHSVWIGKQ